MNENLAIDLAHAFKEFVEFRENKTQLPKGAAHPLRKVFDCLSLLSYKKRDVMFALGVESLTVDRWIDGKGMNPSTYENFENFIHEIIAGKPQRSINVSDTGFLTWRYVFEQTQPWMNRIWYLTSSPFMLSTSPVFKLVATNLFLADKQEQEKRPKPTLIYLYPVISETAVSMLAWKSYLEAVEQKEPLKGTVIGIGVDPFKLPWFLPETRIIMFEKHFEDSSIDVEGYIRIKLSDDVTHKLIKSLDPEEKTPRSPWIQINKNTVENWHIDCDTYFSKIVDQAVTDQGEKPFQVHVKNATNLNTPLG